jgi:hypothetical protein
METMPDEPPIHGDWFYSFLNDVTDANILSAIAREVKGDYGKDKEEEEIEPENKVHQKHPSPTLKRILAPYWKIETGDTCRNEWTCTVAFCRSCVEEEHMDFGTTAEGLGELAFWLEKIRLLTTAANLSTTSSLSGAFVSLNSILKSYWVPKGFAPTDRDATKSPIGVAKNILVRTMEQAHADQMRADIVRRAKLEDKY